MRDDRLTDKAIAFSARILKLYKFLTEEKKEYIVSKQIVRSGTSIGANITEANYGQSKADFISKLHIALKESAETIYWLKLLVRTDYLTQQEYSSLITDCEELLKILTASINTAKK